MRRGKWVGQRTSGAKALPLQGSFIAALKALRHPKVVSTKSCVTQKPARPKKQRYPESCAIQKQLPKKQNLKNKALSYDAGILAAPKRPASLPSRARVMIVFLRV
jgi:hypothetical protein